MAAARISTRTTNRSGVGRVDMLYSRWDVDCPWSIPAATGTELNVDAAGYAGSASSNGRARPAIAGDANGGLTNHYVFANRFGNGAAHVGYARNWNSTVCSHTLDRAMFPKFNI